VVATHPHDLENVHATRTANAVELMELTRITNALSQQGEWHKLPGLISTLDTKIRRTVNLVQVESALKDTQRISEAIEFLDDKAH